MPQIKSQLKRMRVSEKQRLRNRSVKSALKTYIANFNKACEAGEKEQCKEALARAVKNLDTAVSKGVIHKNKAANQKSKLTLKFNAMAEKPAKPAAEPAKEKKPARKTAPKKKPAAKKSAAKKTATKKTTSTTKKTTKTTAAKGKPKTTKKKTAKKTTAKKKS